MSRKALRDIERRERGLLVWRRIAPNYWSTEIHPEQGYELRRDGTRGRQGTWSVLHRRFYVATAVGGLRAAMDTCQAHHEEQQRAQPARRRRPRAGAPEPLAPRSRAAATRSSPDRGHPSRVTLAQIARHALLTDEERLLCSAYLGDATRRGDSLTLLQIATIFLRASGGDYGEASARGAPRRGLGQLDREHRRAAVLYVYELVQASQDPLARSHRGLVLELLGRLHAQEAGMPAERREKSTTPAAARSPSGTGKARRGPRGEERR